MANQEEILAFPGGVTTAWLKLDCKTARAARSTRTSCTNYTHVRDGHALDNIIDCINFYRQDSCRSLTHSFKCCSREACRLWMTSAAL